MSPMIRAWDSPANLAPLGGSSQGVGAGENDSTKSVTGVASKRLGSTHCSKTRPALFGVILWTKHEYSVRLPIIRDEN